MPTCSCGRPSANGGRRSDGDDRDDRELGPPRCGAGGAGAQEPGAAVAGRAGARPRSLARAPGAAPAADRLVSGARRRWRGGLRGGGARAPACSTARDNAPPLAYRIEGGALAPDGRIEARRDVEPALRFADGTVIALARGTKGRLAAVDGRGAHVAIADGTASVNVVPKPHARWRVDAGPFVINVHGTVFTRRLERGDRPAGRAARARVGLGRGAGDRRPDRDARGPAADGGDAASGRVLLRAIDDRDGDLAETTRPRRRPRRGGAAARAGAAGCWRRAAPPAGRAPPPAAAAHRRARAQLAGGAGRGRLRVHRRGRRAGSAACAAQAAAPTIWRRWPTPPATGVATISARRALEAQRRRFHGSPRAADAAFFLGRLDENDGAGLIHALRWYDRYLDEAPSGSYAAEALGRKMVAMRDLYGVAAGAHGGRRVRPPVPARQLRRRRAGAARPSAVIARGRRPLAAAWSRSTALLSRAARARQRARRRSRRPRSSWCGRPLRRPRSARRWCGCAASWWPPDSTPRSSSWRWAPTCAPRWRSWRPPRPERRPRWWRWWPAPIPAAPSCGSSIA